MRKFKVLKCPQEKIVRSTEKHRTPDGTIQAIEKIRIVKAGEEEWYPSAYGHVGIKPGDIIELGGRFADKAAANPDFEEVFEPKPAEKPPVAKKKKRGRPKKVA